MRRNLVHARKGVCCPVGPPATSPRSKMDLAARDRRRRRGSDHAARDAHVLGGDILVYRPQLQHYALLFGDLGTARHVAVVVPGVGDGTNLCDDWIPDA